MCACISLVHMQISALRGHPESVLQSHKHCETRTGMRRVDASLMYRSDASSEIKSLLTNSDMGPYGLTGSNESRLHERGPKSRKQNGCKPESGTATGGRRQYRKKHARTRTQQSRFAGCFLRPQGTLLHVHQILNKCALWYRVGCGAYQQTDRPPGLPHARSRRSRSLSKLAFPSSSNPCSLTVRASRTELVHLQHGRAFW